VDEYRIVHNPRPDSPFNHNIALFFCSQQFVLTNGLQFSKTRFWVVHRRRHYGPFDYEWNKDLCGIEFIYQGAKFGEYCSRDEVCADLKPFRLPTSVYKVASITIGTVVESILAGLPSHEREGLLAARLQEFGFEKFAQIEGLDEAASH
jgi:hypothetical protein